MHGKTVLVAIIDPASDELKLLSCQAHQALKTVDVEADAMQIGSLFARAELDVTLTGRVKYWKHSAVAHLVPSFRGTPAPGCSNTCGGSPSSPTRPLRSVGTPPAHD